MYIGNMEGFRVPLATGNAPRGCQLVEEAEALGEGGPLSHFAKTGRTAETIPANVETPPTEKPLQHATRPQSSTLQRLLQEVQDEQKLLATTHCDLSSELDATKGKVDLIQMQNAQLLKQNADMKSKLDLLMKLVLVLGGTEMKDKMETLIKEEDNETKEKVKVDLNEHLVEAEVDENLQVNVLNLEPPQDALLSTPAPSAST